MSREHGRQCGWDGRNCHDPADHEIWQAKMKEPKEPKDQTPPAAPSGDPFATSPVLAEFRDAARALAQANEALKTAASRYAEAVRRLSEAAAPPVPPA